MTHQTEENEVIMAYFKMQQEPIPEKFREAQQTNHEKRLYNSGKKRQLVGLVDKWEATTQPDVVHNFGQRIIFDELRLGFC